MRIVRRGTLVCERTRGWASLALDSELSEFEQTLLAGHVERCPDCATFVDDLRLFTAELRSAPPVQLTRPVVLPVHRRVAFRSGQVAAAAAVVAAAVGLGTMISASQPAAVHGPIASSTGNQLVAFSDMDADALVRVSRRASLTRPTEYAQNRKFLEIPI